MNIKEAEKRTGISKKTIRYYEEAGLLAVRRAERTGYRLFDEADIIQLKQIKLYRNLGISLQDIRAILQQEKEISTILIGQIQSIEQQISTLQQKRELLQSIMNSKYEYAELISDVEDLIYCDAAIVKAKLARMDNEVIALAAMGASPQVNEFLQQLFPELELKQQQRNLGRVPIETVMNAQLELVTLVNSF